MLQGFRAKKQLLWQVFPLPSEPDVPRDNQDEIRLIQIVALYRWFRSSGGMPPTHLAPSACVPKQRCLSFVEREEIALACARGTGVRVIARTLGRSPSTISREIRRNSAPRNGDFSYRAIAAQWHADRAAKRPKISKLAVNPVLRGYVQDRLAGLIATPNGVAFDGPVLVWKGRRAVHRQSRRWSSAWSPEQISHRLKIPNEIDPRRRRRRGSGKA